MADNTKQFRWIVVLFGNLAAMYQDVGDVLVGGNLFWYPVEGDPNEKNAPDVFVVFGRPKGDRGSYKQWEEGNLPMTVVFEILSPGNTVKEMSDKLAFYDEHGVEEYYIYDPFDNHLMAHVRKGEALRRVRPVNQFVSPKLGIRFDLSEPELTVFLPNGERFLSFEEVMAARQAAQRRADEEKRRADEEKRRADEETHRADEEKRRADEEKRRADEAEERASKLARVVELSRKARQRRASAEELAELDRLDSEIQPRG